MIGRMVVGGPILEIVVVGMGYVGIPAAALFADVESFSVTGVQRRSERSGWKIDYLNAGKSPIGGEEPGLKELIEKVVKAGKFRVTDDTSVYRDADAILIDVQTPVDENHIPMYESLRRVSGDIGGQMKKGALIVIESTVAPGTTQFVVKPILEEHSGMKAGADFNLVYSYERVMVGRLLYNLQHMPRVVGGLTAECTRKGVELYEKICKAKVYPTNCLTAEVAKVTENTYRDVNIAFANEIALVCESLNINVHDVRRLVNSLPFDPENPRKNPYRNMHIPGGGVGGHCLPKDPWLLKYGLDAYGSFGFVPKVIVESRNINDFMPKHMKELLIEALDEKGVELGKASLCILGLAFLEDSDDTRNTPTVSLYEMLEKDCEGLVVHDPYVREHAGVNLTNDLDEAIRGKDAVLVLLRHKQYLELTLDWMRDRMRVPVIVDGRNVFNREECLAAGFTFKGVGLPRS